MTLQERLREVGCPGGRYYEVAQEAADALDAKDERIRELEGIVRQFGIALHGYGIADSEVAAVLERAREALK